MHDAIRDASARTWVNGVRSLDLAFPDDAGRQAVLKRTTPDDLLVVREPSRFISLVEQLQQPEA